MSGDAEAKQNVITRAAEYFCICVCRGIRMYYTGSLSVQSLRYGAKRTLLQQLKVPETQAYTYLHTDLYYFHHFLPITNKLNSIQVHFSPIVQHQSRLQCYI